MDAEQSGNGKVKKGRVYISFDVETSGPIPGDYSLLSIGACVVGNEESKFYSELKPINMNFNKKALEVSGFKLEHQMVLGRAPAEALREFSDWAYKIAEGKKITLASWGEFDYMFLKWNLDHFNVKNSFGINWLDMKSHVHGTKWSKLSKRDLKQKMGVHDVHTHNALDDAIEQSKLFGAIMNQKSILRQGIEKLDLRNIYRKEDDVKTTQKDKPKKLHSIF